MNQNQTVDDDLQKAIDNITNTTNSDPVFSDPVAAPSSIPEGDTGELAEPVGPFPETKVEAVLPGPEPIAPINPIEVPELNLPDAPSMPMPETTVGTPADLPPLPPEPPVQPLEPAPEIAPAPRPNVPTGLNMHQVKEAALRDLVPLIDHLNMGPSQKFNFYRNIFEDLRDYTVLEPAYRAASEITDEHERAEALLYLVEAIDKM